MESMDSAMVVMSSRSVTATTTGSTTATTTTTRNNEKHGIVPPVCEDDTGGAIILQRVDPNQRNNTLVAESDFRAIMSVFSQELHQTIMVQQQGEGGGDRSFCLKQKMLESILAHFPLAVTVASDEAFHTFCFEEENSNHYDEAELLKQQEQQQLTEFTLSDFEEDELVDTSVLERTRALREQVRQQAQRVAQARDAVLTKAETVTQQHMQQFLRLEEKEEQAQLPYENNNNHNQDQKYNDDDGMKDGMKQQQQQQQSSPQTKKEHYEGMVQTMQLALQRTKKLLQEVETKVPVAIDKWNRQMEALEEGDRWGLSQTEQAIRSSRTTKETTTTMIMVQGEHHESPEDRLLSFLS